MSKTQLYRLIIVCAFTVIVIVLAACGAGITPTSTVYPTHPPTYTVAPSNTVEPRVIVVYVTTTPDANLSGVGGVLTEIQSEANTLDANELMSTQIIAGATATVQALTAPASYDDIQRMATMIVFGATATHIAQTAQAVMQSTLEPVQLTVTALAESGSDGQVDSIMGRSVPTPYPTMGAGEETQLQRRWRLELYNALGFEHPVLDTLIEDLLETASQAIEFSNEYGYYSDAPYFSLDLQVERVNFEGDTYVALITRDVFMMQHTRFLMFRVLGDGTVSYIPDPMTAPHYYIMSFDSFTIRCCRTDGSGAYFQDYLGGFVDLNGNGYPDLAVSTGTEGSGGYHSLVILEIQQGGFVADITPVSASVSTHGLIDLNGDGIFEVESWGCAGHPYFDCWKTTNIYRYFGWDGSAYVNISSTLGDEYYPAINDFWNTIQPDSVCVLPSKEMYEALVVYIAWEQLEEAWTRLQPLLRWDACSPEVFIEHYDEMFALQDWVSRNLLWSAIYP